jgi:hypothetical protein
MENKKQPKWLKDKEEANKPKEDVVFVGEMCASGVIDGKLPNGQEYLWYKRRPEPK